MKKIQKIRRALHGSPIVSKTSVAETSRKNTGANNVVGPTVAFRSQADTN